MDIAVDRREFLKSSGATLAGSCLAAGGLFAGGPKAAGGQSAPEKAATDGLECLKRRPAFQAAYKFADLILANGRDVYGPKHTPLFVGQLNVDTLRIPAGTAADPGVFAGDRELAGCQPFCQNLMFDLGLLDVLKTLSAVTGEDRFELARRQYLEYFLKHCRHPKSGYFPWGEHVGYDLVRDEVHKGDFKGCHEVKGVFIPWDQFWDIDAEATRHEIEVTLYNHICDEKTFAFTRHLNMNGVPNRGLPDRCSLADSAGLYLGAWVWLYKKTGDRKFLDRARKMNDLYRTRCSPTTGLFPTAEDRPEELWYGDVLTYACLLLRAANQLGPEGDQWRQQAVAYCEAYFRCAYDPLGNGFYDTINIITGQPVIGPSKHHPSISRPKHLVAWTPPVSSVSLTMVPIMAGWLYAATGNAMIHEMFDRALELMQIEDQLERKGPIKSGDGAGLIFSLLAAAGRSKNAAYARLAGRLADHLLNANRRNGLIVGGSADSGNYYCARLGSNDLASAMLAYAMDQCGLGRSAPQLRNPYGVLSY
jgi:hypothetical protein